MLSKELAGAILGTEVTQISIDGNKVKYNEHYVINIYEMASRCKEWAKQQGVTSFTSSLGDCASLAEFYIGFSRHDFEADTEPEAIFKAGEWMMDLKGD